MISLKRTIAAIIVCLKPHVFLALCILLYICSVIIKTIQSGTGNSLRLGKQNDTTLTMSALIIIVASMWAIFLFLIARLELRNELEALLVLFQCSKRGLRFLGVVAFHIILLASVSLIVSAVVERLVPHARFSNGRLVIREIQNHYSKTDDEQVSRIRIDLPSVKVDKNQFVHKTERPTVRYYQLESRTRPINDIERGTNDLLLYKLWFTAIVYAFLYLFFENLVMFYVDMSLVEFVHEAFLIAVAKVTGIDLSDYPAGEMLLNPLVRRRLL